MLRCGTGPLEVADVYSPEPIIRAKNWDGLYSGRKCHGQQVRGICVYGVGDAPWLAGKRPLQAVSYYVCPQVPPLSKDVQAPRRVVRSGCGCCRTPSTTFR